MRPAAAGRRLRRRLRMWLRPPLPNSAPRSPSPETLDVLGAVVEALLDGHADPSAYTHALVEDACSQPGAAEVQESLAAALDLAARRRHGAGFTSLSAEQRRGLLPRPASPHVHRRRRRLDEMRQRLRRPGEALGYAYIVQPVLRQFAATDAWTVVGYPSHPGGPRGLGAGSPKPPEPVR